MKRLDVSKRLTGRSWQELTRRPSLDARLERFAIETKAGRGRVVAQSDEGELVIYPHEKLLHTELLGTTREGKSKYIEADIVESIVKVKKQITAGHGACLLDPTDDARTANSILKWCIKEGFEKVVLIDPRHRWDFQKVPLLSLFDYRPKYRSSSAENVHTAVQACFGVKQQGANAIIAQNLPLLMRSLIDAGMTLYEGRYFAISNSKAINEFQVYRDYILSLLPKHDHNRIILESYFQTYTAYRDNMATTVRRLYDAVYKDTIELMFASTSGIDFDKLVTKGYLILVNLFPALGVSQINAQFLGSAVINQIIYSTDRLTRQKDKPWGGKFFLYIDEAGRFVNEQIAQVLKYKQKSGLILTLAHHFFSEFDDPTLADLLLGLCKNKIMFHTPNYDDRLKVMKQFYGGQIRPEEAAWVHANMETQHALFKINKNSPVKRKVLDIHTPEIPWKIEKSFIEKLYRSQPGWYAHPDAIQSWIDNRMKGVEFTYAQKPAHRRKAPTRTEGAAPADDPTTRKTDRTDGDNPAWESLFK